jgi:stage III sporulation protein AG
METVIITDAQRAQQGLVKQVNPPVYLGAVVVCQGADRASVRLAIVEAVANATGLGADKISVLKMK